jgi:hypothetical protein
MENTVEFLKDLIKENSKIQKESIKIQTSQLSALDEIKIALQSKPCIVEKKIEERENGWEKSTVITYKWIIGSLLALIVGILSAFGLYAK